MALILHAGEKNKNAYKALIAAEYSVVDVELAPNFEDPVLETPDGPIFESNAIARYVVRLNGDNALYGSSLMDYAHVEQWIDFSSLEIDANILSWYRLRMGQTTYLPSAEVMKAEEAAISSLKRALGALNTHLASNKYLVEPFFTLADIIMTCNLLMGFTQLMTKSFTSKFPHVERYFWSLVHQPKFRKILGEVKQAETVVEEKPKEAEEEEAPKPKPKNPLDLLPPSKMILDEWKRLYSNTKIIFPRLYSNPKTIFREVAIEGFWDMYDPEGYSLWFCDYKYNDENNVSFVTMNKVGGFLQRMDLARKYGFGKMLVIGSESPFKVKGLWLFRGQEIPQFVIDECYDMELYEWKKVDISDEAQKELISQMIEDCEPFEGEPLLDAKCFK
ncbi:hypothetical protein QN277_019797 [Acacia crassicarpa]|uniref:Elongation factor 1-gamma n=1 Tax=Acacia crassicarpa TaxID=499986 RepID=A0AAE1JI74_9FABA|nr:hypothetical protein QN277_019797 [Acacia crassicarpa]